MLAHYLVLKYRRAIRSPIAEINTVYHLTTFLIGTNLTGSK